MALRVVDDGENFFLSKLNGQDLHLHLVAADWTPAETDTVADVTECADGSYAAATLTGGSWTISGGTATYNSVITFTLAGANEIFGFWISDDTDATMYIEQKLSSSLVYGGGGGSVLLQPSISAD